jgi:hypothetical protein
MVRLDPLVESLMTLYSKIRGYERQRVCYDKAYDGNGLDRNAQVSITGMALLREFNIPALKTTPAVYHSYNKSSERINLPSNSDGCLIVIPRIDYLM